LFARNDNPIDKFNTGCSLYKINSCQCYVNDCENNDNLLNTLDSKESSSTTSFNTHLSLKSLNDRTPRTNVQISNENEQLCLKDDVAQNSSRWFYKERKGLYGACLNIQHIMPKLDEIKLHLSDDTCTNILVLTETILSDLIDDKE